MVFAECYAAILEDFPQALKWANDGLAFKDPSIVPEYSQKIDEEIKKLIEKINAQIELNRAGKSQT